MRKSNRFFAYFGAFGTAWPLLRDFGVETEAALMVVVFTAGILLGLRLRVILDRRPRTDGIPRLGARSHRDRMPRREAGRWSGSPRSAAGSSSSD